MSLKIVFSQYFVARIPLETTFTTIYYKKANSIERLATNLVDSDDPPIASASIYHSPEMSTSTTIVVPSYLDVQLLKEKINILASNNIFLFFVSYNYLSSSYHSFLLYK